VSTPTSAASAPCLACPAGARRACWALAIVLSAAGCPKQSEPQHEAPARGQEQGHAEGHEHQALPTHVTLTPAVIKAARIRSQPVAREVLAATLALPGEIVADPDRSARVASPIAGRIEQTAFGEGSVVAKGAPLAVVRVPDLGKLRSTLAATLARAKAARTGAERLRGLVQHHLATEQAYLDALAQAEALEVEARAAAEQISALGLGARGGSASQLTLRAPIAGVVVSRKAVIGQPITAEEVIAEIVDLSEVWFLGRVFEKDLGRLRLEARADVQLNAYPKERFEGSVEYIGRQVDPVARTVTARVRLTNRDDRLRIGLFGTAYVSTGEDRGKDPTLVVPRSALAEIAGEPVVFVQQSENQFELHQLTVGESAAGKVQVITGLREGERVVTEGVFTLKSAVLKSTIAEEE
jgi:cobalt-zinc-cadmium efflux system membrane fusion protein